MSKLPNEEAVKSAAKMLLDIFQKAPCDNKGVSGCIRCNTVFLTQEVLAWIEGSQDVDPLPEPPNEGVDHE